jgi:hypothetical protein
LRLRHGLGRSSRTTAPLWQTPLPSSVFADETLHIFAGFTEQPLGLADLAWVLSDGAAIGSSAVEIGTPVVSGDVLARMAAANRLESSPPKDRACLALTYQLVTDATSYLIVHGRSDEIRAKDLPALHKIVQMHAAGWGGIGSTAEIRIFTDLSEVSGSLNEISDSVNSSSRKIPSELSDSFAERFSLRQIRSELSRSFADGGPKPVQVLSQPQLLSMLKDLEGAALGSTAGYAEKIPRSVA